MDPLSAAPGVPDPDAVEFIRFCYRRRSVGWPELYDEMCAVAGRGLFRGYGTEDLAAIGIGFSLYDMPALATMSRQIVDEEQARRRPVTVLIAPIAEEGAADVRVETSAQVRVDVAQEAAVPAPSAEAKPAEPDLRFVPIPASA